MMNALLTSKPANSCAELDQITHRIREEHQCCIHSPKTALIHACNAGVGLIEVRSQLSPEQWQHWLITHCPLRPETAQIYMEMARNCSHFPQNLLLYSAAKSKQNFIPLPPQANLKKQVEEDPSQIRENSSQTFVFPNPINSTENSHKHTIPKTEADPTTQKDKVGSSTPPSQTETLITPLAVEPPSKSVKPVVQEAPTSPLEPSPEAVIDVDFVPTPPPSSPSSKTGVIRFCLAGGVVPKARPRVTRNGTYLPQRYRAWRNQAEVELYRQMCELHPTPQFPLQKAAISLRFFGNHRTNSDIDNLAGACLDALTLNGAGILKDDRLSCLPQLTVEFVPDTPETGVWIEIEPLS